MFLRKRSSNAQATGALRLQALEVPGGDPAGGTIPPDTVPKMRHAHTRSVAGTAPMDNQMQPVNVDMTVIARRGSRSEGGRYGS